MRRWYLSMASGTDLTEKAGERRNLEVSVVLDARACFHLLLFLVSITLLNSSYRIYSFFMASHSWTISLKPPILMLSNGSDAINFYSASYSYAIPEKSPLEGKTSSLSSAVLTSTFSISSTFSSIRFYYILSFSSYLSSDFSYILGLPTSSLGRQQF